MLFIPQVLSLSLTHTHTHTPLTDHRDKKQNKTNEQTHKKPAGEKTDRLETVLEKVEFKSGFE